MVVATAIYAKTKIIEENKADDMTALTLACLSACAVLENSSKLLSSMLKLLVVLAPRKPSLY